ncbi:acetate kinase [Cryptococcus tetragattii IND107]|uniref:Probable acetate kinase n=1 Tax=Cryptococcus tetragattii IND107 TaxID=1296105 RepID=A0ABR3BIM9_9TREE|nr:acetate kinase [Cryptococcus tetragattii IND107]
MPDKTEYLLAINCGSSSIKGKLFAIPSFELLANLAVTNISSSDERIKIKITWEEGKGKDSEEESDYGDKIRYGSLVPTLLDHLTNSTHVKKEEIKYVCHRVVHGGTHDKGIRVVKGHEEGLAEMDKLSQFAPLHNHRAVLAVKSCLDALPHHTSLLLFDTIFHQTIAPEVYTYALPPADTELSMPLRKYGFHGLSYASIVQSLAEHLKKPSNQVNVVVAHLGSGSSSCCIKNGKSIDTSMGLTPLEGLLGGTRSGTIDPTAIFHHTKDAASDASVGDFTVSKAEIILNKNSGLKALAGTTNFGHIIQNLDPSKCSEEDHEKAKLTYAVYLDRLLNFVAQYLFKLLSEIPIESIDGLVFSGGIGEKGAELRRDVLKKLAWLGAEVDEEANNSNNGSTVKSITKEGSKLKGWVVETDEEGWMAKMAKVEFGF